VITDGDRGRSPSVHICALFNERQQRVFVEGVALSRRIMGPDHRTTLGAMEKLASSEERQGRPAEAETLLREVLERAERAHGPDDLATIAPMTTLGVTLHQQRTLCGS
jgi:hypothetical protein